MQGGCLMLIWRTTFTMVEKVLVRTRYVGFQHPFNRSELRVWKAVAWRSQVTAKHPWAELVGAGEWERAVSALSRGVRNHLEFELRPGVWEQCSRSLTVKWVSVPRTGRMWRSLPRQGLSAVALINFPGVGGSSTGLFRCCWSPPRSPWGAA